MTKLIFDIHTTTGISTRAPKNLTGTLTKYVDSSDKDVALGIAKAQLIDSLPGKTTYSCEKDGVIWFCVNGNHETIKTEVRLVDAEVMSNQFEEAV